MRLGVLLPDAVLRGRRDVDVSREMAQADGSSVLHGDKPHPAVRRPGQSHHLLLHVGIDRAAPSSARSSQHHWTNNGRRPRTG